MRELLGHIRKDVVPALVKKNKSKAKSWKYGYNEDYDIVIVSKDGTLGHIYEIDGLKIGLPAIPEDKTKIINHDLLKYEQKWKRQGLPKGLNDNTKMKYEEYILEEFRRREEGVFVYINGVPEYFSGAYYYFMTWIMLDRDYPHFRYTQKELMLFWEACYADDRCYGILYVKNRRLGWSTLEYSEALNRATRVKYGLVGIISKTGKDAKSMFRKAVRSFKKLPFFFKPQFDGTTNPKTELNFVRPAKRITRNFTKDDEGQDGLDTTIMWYNTDLNAMDGERVSPIMVVDEAGKFPKQVPFSQYWDIAKTCLEEGLEIVGKAMVGSTVNDMDKGGSEFKKVWDDSDYTVRTGNDQTKSGLYRLFIPAEFNMRGFYDEYGFPIVETPKKPIRNNEGKVVKIGSKTYLNNRREGLKHDNEKLNEELRKYPSTITHAFRSSITDSSFDITKIFEQLDYIEQEMPANKTERGDFVWINGIQDTKVRWKPSNNGAFLIAWHPPEDIRNKTIVEDGKFYPSNEHIGALGTDPYNRSRTVDGRGSLGSIHGLTKFNMYGAPSNFFFLEYIHRPKKVELYYEDVIKCMVYFSMPILPELSNEDFLKTLKRRGYRKFVLNRPDVPYRDLSPTEKELGGVPAQSAVFRDAQYYAVESHISDHIGVARDNINREIGEIGKMYFPKTLNDWLQVDPENRTKYDAYISSSLAILANQKRVVKKSEEQSVIRNPFSKYSNRGSYSQRIKNTG